MKIGFTGTQLGMRQSQYSRLIQLLHQHPDVTEFHHGDCIGADAQAAFTIREQFPHIKLVCHPPIKDIKRAFVVSDEYRAAKPYLDRNRDIVDETDLLLVAPKSRKEELRSGTWSTYRYARRLNKATIIMEPL